MIADTDGELTDRQSVTVLQINDLKPEDPVTPPLPEQPTDPLTVSVGDAGWNLYKIFYQISLIHLSGRVYLARVYRIISTD